MEAKIAAVMAVLTAVVVVALVAFTGGGDDANLVTPQPTATTEPTFGPSVPTPLPTAGTATGPTNPTSANTSARGPGPTAAPPGGARLVAKGQPVSGVIRDANGQPIAGAQVSVTVVAPTGPQKVDAQTGPDGGFSVPAPIAGVASIDVRAPGLPPIRRNVVPGQPLDVAVAPPAQIEGVVQGPGAQGLTGAFVRAEAIQDATLPPATVQTGTDGRYVIHGLREGAQYRLRATHPHFAPGDHYEVEAPASNVTLTLYPGSSLIVRVVDANGTPLAQAPPPAPAVNTKATWLGLRAYAEVRGSGISRTLSNWVDADHTQIKFEGLKAGLYTVAAGVRGHGRGEVKDVSVPAGGKAEATLTLQAGGTLRVRILGDHGAVIVGAEVMPTAGFATPWAYLVGAISGPDGTAVVGPIPTGDHSIRVKADGRALLDVTAGVTNHAESQVDAPTKPLGG